MRAPTPVAMLLLGCFLAVIPLHLLDPGGTPATVSSFEWARLVLGLPGAALLPGFLLAPLLLGSELRRGDGLSLPWTLLTAFGLNIGVQALHFNGLRLLGLPIDWPALVALTTVETLAAAILLRRRAPGLRFVPSSRGLRLGAAVLLLALITAALGWRSELTMDSSWNFYSDRLNEPIAQPVDPGALRYDRDWERGAPFSPGSDRVDLVIRNPAQEDQQVPVFFLVHGPLGTEARLEAWERTVDEASVRQMMELQGLDALVERYWEWGSVAVVGTVPVAAQSETTASLWLKPPPGVGVDQLAVIEWSGLSSDELLEHLRTKGVRFMHPFQLLNVTENVRWAHEVSTDYVLSGRAPDGSSTLHQPPGWTYQYAPARLLLTRHLLSATGLFFLILLAIGGTALLAAEESTGERPLQRGAGALLGVGVAATVLQHGRLMISDGSMNFPDNLYALALALAVLLLATGRTRSFLLWAGLATVLRYPGAVVVVLAALSLALLRADLRRRVIDAAMRFGLGVAVFCGVMLLVAVATGALDSWLFALWFETIPEHFDNNPEALALWRRPLEFLRIWALVGGGALVAAIPLRNTLSRVALLTALLYAPFLAFIDHFSHHYFLPLLALVAVSVAANVGGGEPRARTQDSAVFATVAVVLFYVASRMTL